MVRTYQGTRAAGSGAGGCNEEQAGRQAGKTASGDNLTTRAARSRFSTSAYHETHGGTTNRGMSHGCSLPTLSFSRSLSFFLSRRGRDGGRKVRRGRPTVGVARVQSCADRVQEDEEEGGEQENEGDRPSRDRLRLRAASSRERDTTRDEEESSRQGEVKETGKGGDERERESRSCIATYYTSAGEWIYRGTSAAARRKARFIAASGQLSTR